MLSVEWKIQSSEKPWAILLWIVVYVCTKHDQSVSPQTSLLGLALGNNRKALSTLGFGLLINIRRVNDEV
jgi:hypothetical protein